MPIDFVLCECVLGALYMAIVLPTAACMKLPRLILFTRTFSFEIHAVDGLDVIISLTLLLFKGVRRSSSIGREFAVTYSYTNLK